jgi:hypothetical protein
MILSLRGANLADRVSLKKTALVNEEVHEIKHCVPQQVPAHCCENFTLFGYDHLIAIGISSR